MRELDHAITDTLDYGAWQVENAGVKNSVYLISSKLQNHFKLYFLIVIINKPTVKHYFDAIASPNLDTTILKLSP